MLPDHTLPGYKEEERAAHENRPTGLWGMSELGAIVADLADTQGAQLAHMQHGSPEPGYFCLSLVRSKMGLFPLPLPSPSPF
jgi:hypothetical protein